MKRILTLAVLILAVTLVGCGTDDPKQETTTTKVETKMEEKQEEKTEILDLSGGDSIELNKTISFDDFDITFTKIEKLKDYEDKPVMKFTYNWTNKSDKAVAPFITFTLKGFQDGVETDSFFMADGIDLGIGQKEIKPGATIENCEAGIMVTDETKPIDIELTESFSFSNKTYKMTINPSDY